MSAVAKLAAFALLLAAVFAAAVALGRAVGPLERAASPAYGAVRAAQPISEARP